MVKQEPKREGDAIPVCPNCKRKTIYFRANGTVKCRACGYDGEMPK